MKNTSFGPRTFTEQHYAALGKVIVAFQSLEMTITYGLLALLHPEKLAFESKLATAIVNEHSFSNRLKLLLLFPSLNNPLELFSGDDGPNKAHLWMYNQAISLLSEGGVLATEAESKRNQLIHSSWMDGPEGTVIRTKLRVRKNKMQSSHEYMTAKEIEKIADGMLAAQSKLHLAIQDLQFLMSTAIKSQLVEKNTSLK